MTRFQKWFACVTVIVLCGAWSVEAAEKTAPGATPSPVKFTMQRVGSFRSEACEVGDFNGDGKLDIVAGPIWYEAPSWKPHTFRTLRGKVDEKGKGYYDDFMNVAMDVDGDGRTDVVTCCWFAKQLDWYRNTGPGGGEWPMKVVAKTGNHECGDLWDIDGDGKVREILPATRDTHWYEIAKGAGGKQGLVRHMVSTRKSPFGGGVGDVNGDGRPDIIRPDVWYQAPADPRKGKWKAHPLAVGHPTDGKSTHTPQICVVDVNADGLGDIITSAAHNYGIFWYQQVRKGGKITWTRHLIDKSWSQPHSITMVDLDGDGDKDMVTGKRFFAHNGKDPGANDPLGVYWYELKPGASPKWIKHVISYGQGIGAGLSIPVIDIDADGDLDVLVTGKWAGPVLFINQTKSPKK